MPQVLRSAWLSSAHPRTGQSGSVLTSCDNHVTTKLLSDPPPQAVKNLVFLAKALHRLMEAGHMTPHDGHVTDHMTKDVDNVTSESGSVNVDGINSSCDIDSEYTTEDQYHDDNGTTEDHHNDRSGTGGHHTARDLHWLVGRMDRLARQEAAKDPHQSLKVVQVVILLYCEGIFTLPLPPSRFLFLCQRTSVLQWMAALSIDLGPAHLPSYLPTLLPTPYR